MVSVLGLLHVVAGCTARLGYCQAFVPLFRDRGRTRTSYPGWCTLSNYYSLLVFH
jgi:hypothetical protein